MELEKKRENVSRDPHKLSVNFQSSNIWETLQNDPKMENNLLMEKLFKLTLGDEVSQKRNWLCRDLHRNNYFSGKKIGSQIFARDLKVYLSQY